MKNNYYTIISETYKAYIGRYPKSHTVEYLMTEIENKALRESLEVFKKEGLMKAQLSLINEVANKFVGAKKLGIILD